MPGTWSAPREQLADGPEGVGVLIYQEEVSLPPCEEHRVGGQLQVGKLNCLTERGIGHHGSSGQSWIRITRLRQTVVSAHYGSLDSILCLTAK